MASFDFISDEKFRISLESDLGELEACMSCKAWKAVHVLAGSIIETILIDYLLEIDYEKRKNRKLANLSLYEIIEICRGDNVLSKKSADLSHAIREYRNLIHPEKARRLGETADENG